MSFNNLCRSSLRDTISEVPFGAIFNLTNNSFLVPEVTLDKFKIEYSSIEEKIFKLNYTEKLKKIIKSKKITEISSFEIEDKFFEKKISNFTKKENINWNIVQTPMFLNSRENFKKYLSKSKKPFMAVFYKDTRRELDVLIKKEVTNLQVAKKQQIYRGQKYEQKGEKNKVPKTKKTPLTYRGKDYSG